MSAPRWPFRWVLAYSIDALLLVLCFAGLEVLWQSGRSVAWAVIPWVVIGSRQHALAVLGHEGAHRSICANPRLNDFLGALAFLPLGGCLVSYRAWHARHHAYTGTERDPEYRLVLKAKKFALPMTWQRVIGQCAFVLIGGGAAGVYEVITETGPRTIKEAIPPAVFMTLSVAGLVCAGLWWVPAVWFACLCTTFWLCFHLRILTEHLGANGGTHALNAPLWMRALTHPHNIWRHAAHHADPSIPYYHLAPGGMPAKVLFAKLMA